MKYEYQNCPFFGKDGYRECHKCIKYDENCPQRELTVCDNVNHPSHYETGKFECIDVMIETQGVEAVKNFCLCNAFKYLYRHKNKNGIEDVKKAQWYINKYLELEGSGTMIDYKKLYAALGTIKLTCNLMQQEKGCKACPMSTGKDGSVCCVSDCVPDNWKLINPDNVKLMR